MLDLRREDLGGSLALESLRTVDQTTLGVGTAVDEIGVVEGELDGAVDDRVDGLGTQDEDPALARAIVDLGANLGLTIVAEGIERSAQVAQLRRMGCPMGQGYWFARPMPAAEAGEHLGVRPPALL